jgi:hypothetical protein
MYELQPFTILGLKRAVNILGLAGIEPLLAVPS